jgi:hypothetical protein
MDGRYPGIANYMKQILLFTFCLLSSLPSLKVLPGRAENASYLQQILNFLSKISQGN